MREQSIATEPEYRFGYQGKNAEKDDETGWSHFEFREFDPIVGRWLVPDPKRQFWSPYMAMGNNPINKLDPDGKEIIDINTVFSRYGFASLQTQLQPKMTMWEKAQTVMGVIWDVVSSDGVKMVPVVLAKDGYGIASAQMEIYEGATLKNLQKYQDNLESLQDRITRKAAVVDETINKLRKANVAGFNNEEIKSQGRLKYELEDEMESVQYELDRIAPVIQKKLVQEAGVIEGEIENE